MSSHWFPSVYATGKAKLKMIPISDLELSYFCCRYYTGSFVGECKLHEFFITFNMILCVAMSVASVLPIVQEHQPNSGLLQVRRNIEYSRVPNRPHVGKTHCWKMI